MERQKKCGMDLVFNCIFLTYHIHILSINTQLSTTYNYVHNCSFHFGTYVSEVESHVRLYA